MAITSLTAALGVFVTNHGLHCPEKLLARWAGFYYAVFLAGNAPGSSGWVGVFRRADGASWAELDASDHFSDWSGASPTAIEGGEYGCQFTNEKIVVAYQPQPGGTIHLRDFKLASSLWEDENVSAISTYGFNKFLLARRPDGSTVVVYDSGDAATCSIRAVVVSAAGVWGTPFELANASRSVSPYRILLTYSGAMEPNGTFHVFMLREEPVGGFSSGVIWHRTIKTDNTLGTLQKIREAQLEVGGANYNGSASYIDGQLICPFFQNLHGFGLTNEFGTYRAAAAIDPAWGFEQVTNTGGAEVPLGSVAAVKFNNVPYVIWDNSRNFLGDDKAHVRESHYSGGVWSAPVDATAVPTLWSFIGSTGTGGVWFTVNDSTVDVGGYNGPWDPYVFPLTDLVSPPIIPVPAEGIDCINLTAATVGEVFDLTVDLSRWLNAGDAITSAAWTAPAGIGLSSTSTTSTTASVRISTAMAEAGREYILRVAFSTQLGLTEVKSIMLAVRSCAAGKDEKGPYVQPERFPQ